MKVTINPSDLYYKYSRKKATRHLPKFTGAPDSQPFDRNDLYEVIPMFEAVMGALGTTDARVLHRLEELLDELPRCLETREAMYDCLLGVMRDLLEG